MTNELHNIGNVAWASHAYLLCFPLTQVLISIDFKSFTATMTSVDLAWKSLWAKFTSVTTLTRTTKLLEVWSQLPFLVA